MCFSQESQTYIVCFPHIWKNIVSCLSSVPVFYGEKASPASRRILSNLEGETIFIYSLQLNNFLCAQSLQLCSTLCDPMDCSPPNSSVHGILQARILEWIAMPSKVSSWLRDWTHISWALQVDSYPLSHMGCPNNLLHDSNRASWKYSFDFLGLLKK